MVSKKKKPFLGEKKFFEHFGFEVVDSISDYELLALKFEDTISNTILNANALEKLLCPSCGKPARNGRFWYSDKKL